MSNVVALRPENVQPCQVIESVTSISDDIQEIFVVIKLKNKKWTAFASGDLSDIYGAAIHLNRLASITMAEHQEGLEDEG